MLRTVILALHGNAGRDVGDANRRFCFVHVLPAGPAGAVDIDADLFFRNIDLNTVIDHRKHADRGETGMAAGIGIER